SELSGTSLIVSDCGVIYDVQLQTCFSHPQTIIIILTIHKETAIEESAAFYGATGEKHRTAAEDSVLPCKCSEFVRAITCAGFHRVINNASAWTRNFLCLRGPNDRSKATDT